MPATEPQLIEVRVVGVRADHEAIAFTEGVPTNPFTVGSNGQWVVRGDGIGPVHLYLGYDGQRVLVAAVAPALPVRIGASPVGGGWIAVPVPAEIRFGAACLVVRRTSRSALPPGAEVPSTMSDGGALWKAAQRAVHAAHAGGGGPPPEAYPKQFSSTMVMEQRPPLPPAPLPAVAGLPGASRPSTSGNPPPAPSPAAFNELQGAPPPPEGESPAEPKKKNYWQEASPVKKITLVLMPFALVFTYLMLREDARPPPNVIVPGEASARRAARDAGPGAFAAGGGGALNAGGAGAGAAGASTLSGAGTAGPFASGASSATAGPGTTTGIATVAPTSTAAGPIATADKRPAETPSPIVPRGHTQPLKGGKKTPEREALDAVAAGAFDDAARQYEALAEAHPDDPTFKEAARILHIKGGHLH